MRAGAALAALMLAACAHAEPTPRAARGAGDAIIQLKTNVVDAEVVIDGKLAGNVHTSSSGVIGADIAIEPGHHQLEIRHDDYFSAYAAVDLVRGQHAPVELQLFPTLP